MARIGHLVPSLFGFRFGLAQSIAQKKAQAIIARPTSAAIHNTVRTYSIPAR